MNTGTRIINVSRPRFSLRHSVVVPFKYWDLLVNLIHKELRVRYKDSVLGFVWSMLNPILYLVVFYVVFNFFLTGGIPYFPVFLLSGLLPWTLFSTALSTGAGSIVANGPLLKKVSFPREVIPMAAVGAALFHFALQVMVLLAFLITFRYPFASGHLLLLPAALITELLLVAAFAMLLSAITVYLRDIQHFLELGLLAWFWMTPIIYPVILVFDKLSPRGLFGLYLVNPLTPIVLSFQRAFYNKVSPTRNGESVRVLLDQPMSWYFQHLAYVALFALALLAVAQFTFARLEGDFAEEL